MSELLCVECGRICGHGENPGDTYRANECDHWYQRFVRVNARSIEDANRIVADILPTQRANGQPVPYQVYALTPGNGGLGTFELSGAMLPFDRVAAHQTDATATYAVALKHN